MWSIRALCKLRNVWYKSLFLKVINCSSSSNELFISIPHVFVLVLVIVLKDSRLDLLLASSRLCLRLSLERHRNQRADSLLRLVGLISLPYLRLICDLGLLLEQVQHTAFGFYSKIMFVDRNILLNLLVNWGNSFSWSCQSGDISMTSFCLASPSPRLPTR